MKSKIKSDSLHNNIKFKIPIPIKRKKIYLNLIAKVIDNRYTHN